MTTSQDLQLAQFGIDASVMGALKDQSKESSGRESILLKPEMAGRCLVRFVSYVETGKKHSPAKGKIPAKDNDNILLGFEVVTPRHTVTKQDDKGESYVVRDTVTVRLKKGSNPKSAFMNYFKRMDAGRGKTHMIQMLGEGFMADILHTKDEATGEIKYANLHDGEAGVYTIGAAATIDPLSNVTTAIAVPEAKAKLRCFIWDVANQGMWDSLYYKDDKSEESWMHKAIREADNFAGSPAAALLGGVSDLPMGGDVGAPVNQAAAAAGLSALGGL